MKNAIVTSCDAKYGNFLLNHWLVSLRKNVSLKDIDVVVLDYGLTYAQRKNLSLLGVVIVPCIKNGHVTILRWRDLASFLKQTSYTQVMSVDSGDIIFQTDFSSLFSYAPQQFKAVCEDAITPFIQVYSRSDCFSKSFQKEIRHFLKDRSMVNAGLIVGPSRLFIEFADSLMNKLSNLNDFGPDQVLFNYYIYKTGFVQLPSHYNFVLSTVANGWYIEQNKFYAEDGTLISVVHNAGNMSYMRVIEHFGYNQDSMRIKYGLITCYRMFQRAISSYYRMKVELLS